MLATAIRSRAVADDARFSTGLAMAATDGRRTVDLVLQGGGLHGAFGWGVLDRLLEDDSIDLHGIAACGVGAVNAVVLAYGLGEGGRRGARTALINLWRRISHGALFGPTHRQPLRTMLAQCVDFDRLRDGGAVSLFLSAAGEGAGEARIFANTDVTLDAVLASAGVSLVRPPCADDAFDREGSFLSDAATAALADASRGGELLYVRPARRRRESAIAGDTPGWTIDAPEEMRGLDPVSWVRPDWEFLSLLRDFGRDAAERWVEESAARPALRLPFEARTRSG